MLAGPRHSAENSNIGRTGRVPGKRTSDELDQINGRRDQLEGKIQERYGIAKDQARKDVDTWYNAQKW
jgi:uncharacterized protein YjbJ (UPF0337 family)